MMKKLLLSSYFLLLTSAFIVAGDNIIVPDWSRFDDKHSAVVLKATDNGDGTFTLATSGAGGGGGSSDVSIHDFTTTGNHLGVNASGQLAVLLGAALPAGTNVIGHVIVDSGTMAATIADGSDASLGAKADSAASSDTGTFSLISLIKRALQSLTTGNTSTAPLLASGAGGYVRQDSTATMAKEAGGNLATIVTNTTGLATSANQWVGTGTVVSSSALEASHVLKGSAGTLVSLVGYNSRTSSQFIQLFNSTTVPADTTVPILTFTVPAASNFSYDIPIGLTFATGIAVSNSSTAATKTIGSADVFFTAVIK